jgi:hypothetical protein
MSSGSISAGFSLNFNNIPTGDATKLQASPDKAKSVEDEFKQYADMTTRAADAGEHPCEHGSQGK